MGPILSSQGRPLGNWDDLVSLGAHSLGLDPGPFLFTEASADEQLIQYFVDFDIDPGVWHSGDTFFVAPPGSGKTALRIYSALSCWERYGQIHPLPVSLIPEIDDPRFSPFVGRDRVMEQMMKATMIAIWLTILYQPYRLIRLSLNDQDYLLRLLDRFLPARLSFYLSEIDDIQSLRNIRVALDRSYRNPSNPQWDVVQELRQIIGEWCTKSRSPLVQAPIDRSLTEIIRFVRKNLGFGNLLYLIDGLDSSQLLIQSPEYGALWLNNFIQIRNDLSIGNDIVFKAFLPLGLEKSIRRTGQIPQVIELKWTRPRLQEMIRRRVQAASDNAFDSLDALVSSPKPGIDKWIIERAPSQPREILRLFGQIFIAHARRRNANGGSPLLTIEDIENAFRQFEEIPMIGASA